MDSTHSEAIDRELAKENLSLLNQREKALADRVPAAMIITDGHRQLIAYLNYFERLLLEKGALHITEDEIVKLFAVCTNLVKENFGLKKRVDEVTQILLKNSICKDRMGLAGGR